MSIMVNFAPNSGYYGAPEQPLESVDFSAIAGFQDAAKSWQGGMNGLSASSTLNSATNAGARTESGFAKFDYAGFGKERDALNASSGSEGDGSYQATSDRTKAAEEPMTAMGVDLKEYSHEQGVVIELRKANIPEDVIARARGQMGITSAQDLIDYYNQNGELTPEAKAASEANEKAVAEIAKTFQLAMQMDNGKMATNGFDATLAGGRTTAQIGQAAGYAMMS